MAGVLEVFLVVYLMSTVLQTLRRDPRWVMIRSGWVAADFAECQVRCHCGFSLETSSRKDGSVCLVLHDHGLARYVRVPDSV